MPAFSGMSSSRAMINKHYGAVQTGYKSSNMSTRFRSMTLSGVPQSLPLLQASFTSGTSSKAKL